MVHRLSRFTDALPLSFLRLCFSFMAIAVLSASSCPTDANDDSPCGEPGHLIIYNLTAAQALTSSDLEVTLSGGVRTFSWARVIENVCSEKHASADWSFSGQADKLPPGWRVDAGYVITPVLGGVVTLKATDSNNVRTYDGEAEFGLSQAFQGQPGRFLTFLDISFTSQGNLQADQAVVQSLFRQMRMGAEYQQAKTN